MTIANTEKNKRLKAERHAKRMKAQHAKVTPIQVDSGIGAFGWTGGLNVPRGTARALRRKPLQVMYAKRLAKQAEAAALA